MRRKGMKRGQRRLGQGQRRLGQGQKRLGGSRGSGRNRPAVMPGGISMPGGFGGLTPRPSPRPAGTPRPRPAVMPQGPRPAVQRPRPAVMPGGMNMPGAFGGPTPRPSPMPMRPTPRPAVPMRPQAGMGSKGGGRSPMGIGRMSANAMKMLKGGALAKKKANKK